MVYRGQVTRIASNGGLYVLVPRLSRAEFGPVPCVRQPKPYAAGDEVMLGFLEGRPDHPMVMGVVDAPSWAAPAVTGRLPTGGAAAQALVKTSGADYAAAWATLVGLPAGGASGQVLAKTAGTDYVSGWATLAGVPAGGSTGQTLVKASGADYATAWASSPVGPVATVTTVTSLTGWTGTSITLSRVPLATGAVLVVVRIQFTRATGAATLTADSAGNIAPDEPVCTLPTGYRPDATWTVQIQAFAKAPAIGQIDTTGTLVLMEGTPAVAYAAGQGFRVSTTYLVSA